MTLLPQNLTDLNRQLSNYLYDQRPLNIDEMRAFKQVLDEVTKHLTEIYRFTPIKNIPYAVQYNWTQLKNIIGNNLIP